MVPMAIPSFGGMLVVVISIFVVPVLFCVVKEFAYRSKIGDTGAAILSVGTLFVVPVFYCAISDLRMGWLHGNRSEFKSS